MLANVANVINKDKTVIKKFPVHPSLKVVSVSPFSGGTLS